MENAIYRPALRLVDYLSELASSLKTQDPAESVLDMLAQKSALRIIAKLSEGPTRFNPLVRECRASANTVRARLNELAEANIVERVVRSQMPPNVIFSLTETGRQLAQVLAALLEWEARWRRPAMGHAAVSIAAEERKPYRPV